MEIDHITKEKVRVKNPRKHMEPTLFFNIVDSVEETEIQRRLDSAFDILFTEVFKNNGNKLV